MQAALTKQEISAAIAAGKDFVVFNVKTGAVVSLHKSRDGADRKAAKMGFPYGVNNLRAGYVY